MSRKYDVNTINIQIVNIDFWSPHNMNKGGVRVYWSSDIGYGTLDIVKQKGNDGDDYGSPKEELLLISNTECMDSQDDKAFTRKLMELMVEKIQVLG